MAQVTMNQSVRKRQNIRELQDQFEQGNKKPLSDYLRAWQGITTGKTDVTDPDSFFMIAGYHGEPFRGAGWGNPQWWGGYCNHGNVLFPTWHRAYLYRLENALRSVKGCEHVALAYWDECEEKSVNSGIPEVFLWKQVTLDTGKQIDNPLFSYKFQLQVWDNAGAGPANGDYYKSKGYTTKRFPYCGFDGQITTGNASTDDPVPQSQVNSYNKWIDTHTEEQINASLNTNVKEWISPSKTLNSIGIKQKYLKCLDAPNYTVFSNTTSAAQWNELNLDVKENKLEEKDPNKRLGNRSAEVPLESPHNDMHLAVGGFQLGPDPKSGFDPATGVFPKEAYPKENLARPNGDMGENNTASFDPIFFHHHCYVDKVFWDWQKKHNAKDKLEIIHGYPGTNSVDSQGPTPGVAGGTWLTMESPLDPFKEGDKRDGPALNSTHVVNIEKQLGYTYAEKQNHAPLAGVEPEPVTHHAKISGLNRGSIGGSFVIQVHKVYTGEGERNGEIELVGFESVLSRWQTSGCANCQNHLSVKSFIPLPGVTDEDLNNKTIKIVPSVVPRQDHNGKLLVGGGDIPTLTHQILVTAPPAQAS